MTYHLSVTKYRDDPYQIAIYDTRHDMMMGHNPDYHQAQNPEELLVFLMGVYDWYPEGYDNPSGEDTDYPWVAIPEGGD